MWASNQMFQLQARHTHINNTNAICISCSLSEALSAQTLKKTHILQKRKSVKRIHSSHISFHVPYKTVICSQVWFIANAIIHQIYTKNKNNNIVSQVNIIFSLSNYSVEYTHREKETIYFVCITRTRSLRAFKLIEIVFNKIFSAETIHLFVLSERSSLTPHINTYMRPHQSLPAFNSKRINVRTVNMQPIHHFHCYSHCVVFCLNCSIFVRFFWGCR